MGRAGSSPCPVCPLPCPHLPLPALCFPGMVLGGQTIPMLQSSPTWQLNIIPMPTTAVGIPKFELPQGPYMVFLFIC